MQLQIRQSLEAKLESFCLESIDSSRSLLKEKLRQLICRVRRYYSISKQRQALGQLSDDLLKDIGISKVDAMAEANKPFWKD